MNKTSARPRRWATWLLALALVGSVLAACGNDDTAAEPADDATDTAAGTETETPAEDAEPPGDETEEAEETAPAEDPPATTETDDDSTAAAAGAFPLTLEQPSGAVTIEVAPERIYVVDAWALDLVTALGIVPVGAATFSPPPSYIEPGEFDLSTVTIIDGGLNAEAIAATQPDLIIDASGFFTQADTSLLETLSGIAPVLGPPDDYLTTGWRERMLHVAAAVGRTTEAEALIADADGRLAEIRSEFPELDGAAVTFAQYLAETTTFNAVAGDEDFTRAYLNAEFGLTTPEPQLAAFESGEFEMIGGVLVVSLERVDLVVDGADAAIVFVFGDPAALDSQPVWTSLPLVAAGGAIAVDLEGVFALRTPSPAAIEYTATELMPALAAAITGE